jgi:FKBP-type peptidyl-prolyl cis-trans isomerase (trigger factor)
MLVEANKIVSLRFTLKNKQGEILDDIMTEDPIEYLHGSGNILPALEAGIEGLRTGDRKSITFSDDTSPAGESYCVDVIVDDIREATSVELQQGKPELKQSDKPCGPGCCC